MTDTWIKETGQLWKLYVFATLLATGIVLFALFMVNLQDGTSSPDPLLAVGFATVILLALGWLFVSLRCNRCGGRPAWWVVRHVDANEWFILLISMRECPICALDRDRSDA